jgi:hypothetical protein
LLTSIILLTLILIYINFYKSDNNNEDGYSYDNNSSSELNTENNELTIDKRRSRNENEKKRRDQFNDLIDKLGSLLNHEHKSDKSTTLLETLNFFKSYSLISGEFELLF